MSTLESTSVNFSVFSFLNLSRNSWMIQTQSCQSSSNGTKNLVLEATKKTCKVSPHKMGYNRSKWSYGAPMNGFMHRQVGLQRLYKWSCFTSLTTGFRGPHFANHQKNNSPTFNNHETRLRPLRVPSSPPPWSPNTLGFFGAPNAARFSMASEMAPRERGRALFLSYKFIGIYRVKQLHLQGI